MALLDKSLDKWEGTVGMQLPQNGPAQELAQHSAQLQRADAGNYKPTIKETIESHIPGKKSKSKNSSKEPSPATEERAEEGGYASGTEEEQVEQDDPELVGGHRFKQKVGGRLNAQDDYESELLDAQRRTS